MNNNLIRGSSVEGRVIRSRFQDLCNANGLELVDFHSLRHLSTKYKLKLTNGDIKSVQGDTGHAEAEMVTDVYSEIVDEDRRHAAEKMNQDFYKSLLITETDNDELAMSSENAGLLLELIKALNPASLSNEMKEKLIKQVLFNG